MIIYNLKLNKKLIFKTCLAIMAIVCICLAIFELFILFKESKKDDYFEENGYCLPDSDIAVLTAENYTNVLKEVHDDIDTYVGQKISFTGYVYRVAGFSEDQFVLARDMDIGNNQTLIVGFLCSSNKIKDFQNNTWINITGEITKGEYNENSIPIVKISSIEETSMPSNPTVPLPDDEYVPTAVIY
jgi:uncharacterized membrane protein YcgQ (UPF0703/DUF1980 family)